MADTTYVLIEGKTETKEDIESFMVQVRNALENQFAPRDITISIQEPLSENGPVMVGGLTDPKAGYS